jgi:hypothetical protein
MAFIRTRNSYNEQEAVGAQRVAHMQLADNRHTMANQLQLQTMMRNSTSASIQSKQQNIIRDSRVTQKKQILAPVPIQKIAHSGNVVQRGKLQKATEIVDMSKIKKPESRRMFRTLLLNRLRNQKYIKRNKLAFTLSVNGLNVTIHLDSRGLGGSHPRYKNKSSAHTEQIVRAIMGSRKDDLVKILNKKLKNHKKSQIFDFDNSVTLTSIVSSNSPCNSNAGDHQHGCGGIETKALGMSDTMKMGYLREYQGEDKEADKTDYEGIKEFLAGATSKKEFKDEDSSDEEIDTEYLRGKDIETTPLKFLQSPNIRAKIGRIKRGKNKNKFKVKY